MIDFLIMYEVHVREFESIILLGNELKHRGYSVEYLGFEDCMLGDYVKNLRKIKRYFNKVKTVLMPSLYHDKELLSIVYYVCGKCTNVVNLRWEQYFTNENMKLTDGYLYPHGDAKKAYHMCWGQRSYENMREAGVSAENLLLTGPIQLDLLRPEFSDYYFPKEEIYRQYDIPRTAKTVLYISSFVGATLTEQQFVGTEKDFDGAYKRDNDAIAFQKYSYFETLAWIDELLTANPNATFIYRPHPSENITEALKKLISKHATLKVISDHSVKQWIMTCDVVATWVSTSIVEAYFANKPVFIVRPFPFDQEKDMCTYQNAKFVTEKSAFLNILNDKAELSVSNDIMQIHYDVDSDIPSYVRLCNRLEEICAKDTVFPWDDEKIHAFEKTRGNLFFKSVIYQIYRVFLCFLSAINRKTGIGFGKLWRKRIENYNVKREKRQYEKLNKGAFSDISERLTPIWIKSKVK